MGPAIALGLLSLTGYVPSSEVGMDEGSTAGLKLLFVFGPAAGMLLTALIAWKYPLTEDRHLALRAELEAARAQGR